MMCGSPSFAPTSIRSACIAFSTASCANSFWMMLQRIGSFVLQQWFPLSSSFPKCLVTVFHEVQNRLPTAVALAQPALALQLELALHALAMHALALHALALALRA